MGRFGQVRAGRNLGRFGQVPLEPCPNLTEPETGRRNCGQVRAHGTGSGRFRIYILLSHVTDITDVTDAANHNAGFF